MGIILTFCFHQCNSPHFHVCKLRPCLSCSRPGDCIDLGLFRTLDKGGWGVGKESIEVQRWIALLSRGVDLVGFPFCGSLPHMHAVPTQCTRIPVSWVSGSRIMAMVFLLDARTETWKMGTSRCITACHVCN